MMTNIPVRVAAALADESGEVTIAWVVLTAALASLALAVLTSVGGGAQELASDVEGEMAAREVTTGYN